MLRSIVAPATGRDADVPTFRATAGKASAPHGHVVLLHIRLDVQRMVASVATGDVGWVAALGDVLQSLEPAAATTEARAREQALAFCRQAKLALAGSPLAEHRSARRRHGLGPPARRRHVEPAHAAEGVAGQWVA
jgi:hypothetical protein